MSRHVSRQPPLPISVPFVRRLTEVDRWSRNAVETEVAREAARIAAPLIDDICRQATDVDRDEVCSRVLKQFTERAALRYKPTRGTLAGMLVAIAKNVIVDVRRENGRRRFVPLDDAVHLADPGPSPDDALMADEHAITVERDAWLARRALDTLPPRQRRVIRQHGVGGVSLAEIARRENVATSTVSRVRRRGLDAVHALLGATVDGVQRRSARGAE